MSNFKYDSGLGKVLAMQRITYTSTTSTPSVSWEMRDPSGASIYLSDGARFELDPTGTDVGLYTLCVELQQPTEPEYPSLQPINMEMPMYVNGQRVTATLNGMEIPYAQARSMLNNGSAISASIAHLQSFPGFQINWTAIWGCQRRKVFHIVEGVNQ